MTTSGHIADALSVIDGANWQLGWEVGLTKLPDLLDTAEDGIGIPDLRGRFDPSTYSRSES
jgi:hypothetical protein